MEIDSQILKILEKEPKLIEIKDAKKVIFVGDTHRDLEVSQKIIKDYLKPGNKIVFLGDYVDRGLKSKENLDFLLKTKTKYPDRVFLLQGNHEGHRILKFSPAEFWQSLNDQEYDTFSTIVEKMSLAVVAKDVIALHGALPDVKSLEEINKIKLGDENWLQITWGDFSEENRDYNPPASSSPPSRRAGGAPYLEIDPLSGRPQFGRDYFFKLMERFNKKVLIRSHQANAPKFMFDDRCLTIFTSSAYTRERTIAIYNFQKPIKTAKDLEIKII